MNAILDTGPWVALIDRSESKHEVTTEWLQAYEGKLFTTEAILTEVLYLLNFSIIAQTAALDFVLHSVVYARHGHNLMGCKSPIGKPLMSLFMEPIMWHWRETSQQPANKVCS